MSHWISNFQLFLFDFDGLLVNTEAIHYQAYINMLAARGCKVDWSFTKFCELAHLSADALREAICTEFPELEAHWPILYAEKKRAYQELLGAGKINLMPGVEPLLRSLERANIQRCVVTNSTREQTKLIASHLPILQTIPHWITREDYEKPKPSPECYLKAISLLSKKGDRVIGFEDSLRGLQALKGTPALPVLVCPEHHPLLEMALEEGGVHFPSFEKIPEDWRS